MVDAPRAIVRVQWGRHKGRTAVLRPGQAVRIGRGERASLVVPDDPQLSAVHFEVGWDGARLSWKDLRSATGTLPNGEAGLTSGELSSGDWLRAGNTMFTVHLEGHTPPRIDDEEDDLPTDNPALAERREERRKHREALTSAKGPALTVLSDLATREPLYTVLDAARDRRILELLRESVEEYASLYDGVQGDALSHVAPYLARLPAGSQLTASLVSEGFGKRWGIFATSKLPFGEVRRHFRRFLMVESEVTEQRMYFRYYDPAILCTFLSVATTQQYSDLFASLLHLAAEGPGLTTFVYNREGRLP